MRKFGYADDYAPPAERVFEVNGTVDALLLDLSGVLYEGGEVVPGARDAVARAQDAGLVVRFVTNSAQRPRRVLLERLRGMGFNVEDEQFFTAVDAARAWLVERELRPYCLVHEAIREEFSALDQSAPNAVLIADAAEGFTYARLNRAFQLCMDGAVLVAAGYNRYYRAGGELVLDAGAFVRALEFAAGVEAVIVGKPGAAFFSEVLASAGVSAGRALMVGDDVFGDVEGALAAGLCACLVRTGKYREGDERAIEGEFALMDSVVDAVDFALHARGAA